VLAAAVPEACPPSLLPGYTQSRKLQAGCAPTKAIELNKENLDARKVRTAYDNVQALSSIRLSLRLTRRAQSYLRMAKFTAAWCSSSPRT
jgi:hypothetical protein